MSKLFVLVIFCFFISCGSNFLGGPADEENEKSLAEILSEEKHLDFIKKLLNAVVNSKNPDKYYKILQDMIFPQGIKVSSDLLKDLSKLPQFSSSIQKYFEDSYQEIKNNFEETGEGLERLQKSILASLVSDLKGSFYTEDNKFDFEKGEETLTLEKSNKIIEKMILYDEISSEDSFKDVTEDSSGKSNSEKILDYMKLLK